MLQTDRLKILLIDDCESDYALTKACLEKSDNAYELEWQQSYETGLDRIIRNNFDICLLDYKIGAESGVMLAREARARGCHNPIILFSGMDAGDIERQGHCDEVTGYISKKSLSSRTIGEEIKRMANGLITARHETASDSRLSGRTQAYRHIVESLPDPVMALDDKGKVVLINEALCSLLTLEEKDIMGVNAAIFVDCSAEELRAILHGGQNDKKLRTFVKSGNDRNYVVYWQLAPLKGMSGLTLAYGRVGFSSRRRKRSLASRLLYRFRLLAPHPDYVRSNKVFFHRDFFS